MPFNFLQSYANLRTAALLVLYALICSLSYVLAYELRFDFNVPDHFALERVDTIWWVVLLKLSLLASFGQLDALLSYFRLPDALSLFGGLATAAVILVVLWYLFGGAQMPPRSVILTDMQFSFLALATFRVLMRVKSSRDLVDWLVSPNLERVLIAGAGEVGAGLCSELLNKTSLGMRPVAFVDDDKQKIARYVHGVPVVDSVDALTLVAKRYAVTKVVVAFPSASVKRVKYVADMAQAAGLKIDIVPALTDLVSGRAQLSQLRPIQLEDLLGRDAVDLDCESIASMLSGKRILVTGAGGSIGRELVAQILDYSPASLLALDQAEIAIFSLEQEILSKLPTDGPLVATRIVDIYNTEAVEALFDEMKPEVVFHAAAHKHVNLMESQPAEALRNNFFATASLARIARMHGVDHFVLISTDKAINPTSAMGASKRMAELSLLNEQTQSGNRTRFIAVRFGNVLGSSGSVVPVFRKQIAAGGPVTVTHPEVTRFFMTVEEAVGLVMQSATQGDGGEIFVLNMGKAVKIVDVARQMISLSGYDEASGIQIKFTGLRPGEKLYEEVQHASETLRPTQHSRVMRFVSKADNLCSFDAMIAELRQAAQSDQPVDIKRKMRDCIPEYAPYLDS